MYQFTHRADIISAILTQWINNRSNKIIINKDGDYIENITFKNKYHDSVHHDAITITFTIKANNINNIKENTSIDVEYSAYYMVYPSCCGMGIIHALSKKIISSPTEELEINKITQKMYYSVMNYTPNILSKLAVLLMGISIKYLLKISALNFNIPPSTMPAAEKLSRYVLKAIDNIISSEKIALKLADKDIKLERIIESIPTTTFVNSNTLRQINNTTVIIPFGISYIFHDGLSGAIYPENFWKSYHKDTPTSCNQRIEGNKRYIERAADQLEFIISLFNLPYINADSNADSGTTPKKSKKATDLCLP